MKNIFWLLPFLAALSGCSTPKEPPILKVPSPSDIALQATEDYFSLHVDVLENSNDQEAKVRQFTTVFQDNSCDVDVDSTTLKVVKMSCHKIKSSQEQMIDKIATPKGKEAIQKLM